MTLDTSKLRERLQSRGYKSPERKKALQAKGRKPLPDPVMKRQEEQAALLEAAERRHKARVVKWANQHEAFQRYVAILSRELPETYLVEPGLVDLDLAELITALQLAALPHDVRFGALVETQKWIKEVHKRRTRSSDITPYKRLFSPKFVDSLSEAREALKLH